MKQINVAINGFGRIGRLFFRQAIANQSLKIVAINDLGDKENLAYLLKYDTVYGRFDEELKVTDKGFSVSGQEIIYLQQKDPTLLPWKDFGVDIVVESTGVFESYEKAKVHITSGAKRVVITAPAKDVDGPEGKTVLMGINETDLKTCNISSNGSCTTNAASPVIQIMNETIGIEKAILSTVHAYTATQNIVDGPTKGKDFRRGRAGAQNIAPSTTGAAVAVTRAIPELALKFDGMAMRVPVPAGSIADITFLSKKNTTAEEVNKILKKAASEPRWNKVLKVSDDLLVSSDILGEPHRAPPSAHMSSPNKN